MLNWIWDGIVTGAGMTVGGIVLTWGLVAVFFMIAALRSIPAKVWRWIAFAAGIALAIFISYVGLKA